MNVSSQESVPEPRADLWLGLQAGWPASYSLTRSVTTHLRELCQLLAMIEVYANCELLAEAEETPEL